MNDRPAYSGSAPSGPCVVVINGGSSSIKFALYGVGAVLARVLDGQVDIIASTGARLTYTDRSRAAPEHGSLAIRPATSLPGFLADWFDSHPLFGAVQAVGHRVVHGMHRCEPAPVTTDLLRELRGLLPFDPGHLPLEIELIESFRRRHPALQQLVCFDTAFHRCMPRVAKQLPVPRSYEALGVQRYGFHGLSYTYMMEQLERAGDPAAASGLVILAHLGSGASMAAVRAGKCIDTSMGFTPASGLMMGTRSGDLDPGLVSYLLRTGQTTPTGFQHVVNHESGLLGVSQLSSDVRQLLALESTDVRAAEALALFCYQASKYIGAYAAALGGLDTLVFAGGIGENSPPIRERICSRLDFLGIHIDPPRNAANAALISPDDADVSVRVIRTDEELIIARACAAMLAT